ncbi:MAG: Fe-S cluster assembly protein SufD [Methylococcales bacterium]|jgi:Fe-S cluster assembly protein SufD|nr:Fe-S cluster assembly protein SufD [Methylococcales bacterium]MBT7411390.1 Fe-S cluster assembly protein SufD [Methylococcales bacterium]
MSNSTQPYITAINSIANELPGNNLSWLQNTRNNALKNFETLGFPNQKNEAWKYTKTNVFGKKQFSLCEKPCVALLKEDISHLRDDQYLNLVFINGYFTPQLSDKNTEEGLILTNLQQMLCDSSETIQPFLSQYSDIKNQSFNALNTAYMNDGSYIKIQNNQVIKKPIQLIYLTTQQSTPAMTQPRNLIIAEPNSQATIIENYATFGESEHFTNSLTEIITQENSSVEHIKIQQECSKAYHIASISTYQHKDSRFTSHSFVFDGKLTRNEINSVFAEEGCECTLNGLYLVSGQQHVDHQTSIEHVKPNGTSKQTYKGILADRSRAVFNGRVKVHKNAQKSFSEQTNDNLLLSEHAEIDTKPQLEIYADDVKCAHGATVGQLNPEEIFYLQARGIGYKNAKELLTVAFANDMINKIKVETLQKMLQQKLSNCCTTEEI